MFGLLKNKIKGFTDKILGKTKLKVESQDSTNSKNIKAEKIRDIKKTTDEIINYQDSQSISVKREKHKVIKIKPVTKIKNISIKSNSINTKIDGHINNSTNSFMNDKNVVINDDSTVSKTKTSEGCSKDVVGIKQNYLKPIQNNVEKSVEYKSLDLDKKEKIKKNVLTSIKGIFSSKIKLSENEITSFLEEFELSLLEADVSLDSASNIVKDLKNNLTSANFDKNNLLDSIKEQIKTSLKSQLDIDCNINNFINNTKKENEPYIILFIGPNGVGKTTTIAKLGFKYKNQNQKIIFSSSDTFRAGSIQQLEKHGSNLNIRVIKQDYGSDPAAVAYDAVNAAKASNCDYVFIDTAGRQETNYNLMQELKKIKRVVKPNLTIYVAESQAGQAVVEQIQNFDSQIGVDGVILTKIDTDPKGGVAISILNELKKPIFFIGTGQKYNDLIPFNAEFIIDRIV